HDGRIKVLAERLPMDGSEWVVFRVSDTGIGLSPEQIVRLFQPFTQADPSTTRKFGGTGLGLALTRRFCQMMSGDVTVHSVPDEGSVFTIKLPATIRQPTQATPIEEDRRTSSLATNRDPANTIEPLPAIRTCVLGVDDDPMQRHLMQPYLRKEAFSVHTANGGAEGLQLDRQLLP